MNYECMSFQANGANYERMGEHRCEMSKLLLPSVLLTLRVVFIICGVCMEGIPPPPFLGKVREEDKNELTDTVQVWLICLLV